MEYYVSGYVSDFGEKVQNAQVKFQMRNNSVKKVAYTKSSGYGGHSGFRYLVRSKDRQGYKEGEPFGRATRIGIC